MFGYSENVQTVYKVCKLMYCAVVHACPIFLTILVRFNHLCSFLPMKCVHKCVDELHKISCNSYYTMITQQRTDGASILSWGSSPTSYSLEILV